MLDSAKTIGKYVDIEFVKFPPENVCAVGVRWPGLEWRTNNFANMWIQNGIITGPLKFDGESRTIRSLNLCKAKWNTLDMLIVTVIRSSCCT